MSKGLSFKEAKQLRDALEKGLILKPDAAVENIVAKYHAQISNLWTLREQVLLASLNGGAEVSPATIEKAENVAKELLSRRCNEAIQVNDMTDKKHPEEFLFLCSLVGIDVEPLLKDEKAEPKLVQSH
jgi:hypothetical protein